MKKWILCFLLFWVIPVWADSFRSVDNYARRVPDKYDTSLEAVVKYLVKPFPKDDEKKARVLFAWIVYHIDYDGYAYRVAQEKISGNPNRRRQGVSETGDIFETRLGMCGEIAALYQRMAQLAGMEAVTISGYADTRLTARNKEKYGHAWNAVKIKGNWEFVDATWAMSGRYKMLSNIRSDDEYLREIEKRKKRARKTKDTRTARKIDNDWFMTKPEEMIRTHFPKDPQWQLLKNPRTL